MNGFVNFISTSFRRDEYLHIGDAAKELSGAMTAVLFPIRGFRFTDENGRSLDIPLNQSPPKRLWDDHVRMQLQNYNEHAIQSWLNAAVDFNIKEIKNSLDALAHTLTMRTFHMAQISLYAGQTVVIPKLYGIAPCEECDQYIVGKVFYVDKDIPANPSRRDWETSFWINKDLDKRPWYINKTITLPLHPKCHHIMLPYHGGDPHGYYLTDSKPTITR